MLVQAIRSLKSFRQLPPEIRERSESQENFLVSREALEEPVIHGCHDERSSGGSCPSGSTEKVVAWDTPMESICSGKHKGLR